MVIRVVLAAAVSFRANTLLLLGAMAVAGGVHYVLIESKEREGLHTFLLSVAADARPLHILQRVAQQPGFYWLINIQAAEIQSAVVLLSHRCDATAPMMSTRTDWRDRGLCG